MLLYHGTAESTAAMIRRTGLLPRSRHRGKHNWKDAFAGNRHAIYLTDAYPITYAVEAVRNIDATQRLAIIEVDSDVLDTTMFAPDEDMLEQALRGRDNLPADWTLSRRSRYYQARLRDYGHEWQKSLQAMGTCAYLADIPPTAIRRIALIDKKAAQEAVWTAVNAMVSLANYRLVGLEHRAITRWFFGDAMPQPANEMEKFLNEDRLAAIAAMTRSGIEIIEIS